MRKMNSLRLSHRNRSEKNAKRKTLLNQHLNNVPPNNNPPDQLPQSTNTLEAPPTRQQKAAKGKSPGWIGGLRLPRKKPAPTTTLSLQARKRTLKKSGI